MKALSQKRRHPLAAIALLLMGLLVTGGLYAVATTVNQAKADTTSYQRKRRRGGRQALRRQLRHLPRHGCQRLAGRTLPGGRRRRCC